MDNEEPEEDSLQSSAESLLALNPKAVNDLSEHDFDQVFEFMYNAWCFSKTVLEVNERNLVFFGEIQDVSSRYTAFSTSLTAVKERMELKKPRMQVDQYAVMKDKFDNIVRNMFLGKDAMVQTYRQISYNDDKMRGCLPSVSSDCFFGKVMDSDYTSAQVYIRFALDRCATIGLRKQGTSLYAPIFSLDGKFMHAFFHYAEMMKFIHNIIFPYEHHQQLYCHLTANKGIPQQVVNYLQHCQESALPEMSKDRTRFAFNNGVYDAALDQFFPLGSVPPATWGSKTCCNHIELDFEADVYDEEMSLSSDPMDILTPNFQRMFDTQRFSREVCRWLYGLLGRCLFDLGTKDKWEVFLLFKGTAGTGKSSIMQMFYELYAVTDCGVLSTSCSKTFPIQHLADKFVWKVPDVNNQFQLEATMFNTMVSGEKMEVQRKGLPSLEMVWKSPGMGAGNCFFPFKDAGGSAARRVIPAMYDHCVPKTDPNLQGKCKAELARFLCKITRIYDQLSRRYSGRGIWDSGVLPDEFHDWKQIMVNSTHTISIFLADRKENNMLEFDMEHSISWFKLRTQYMTFAAERRMREYQPFETDTCAAVFQTFGLTIVNVPKNSVDASQFDGFSAGSKYVKGVRVKEV
jgi:hypothetical protein